MGKEWHKTIQLALLLGLVSCASQEACDAGARARSNNDELPPFKESCMAFESLVFSERTSSRLAGNTIVETDSGFIPFPAVQVAARHLQTGERTYTVSKDDGSYDLSALLEGEYEVWTCRNGYDELRFKLKLDSNSEFDTINLYLQASESGAGRVDVEVTTSR